jgi:hypothetical protein
MFVLQYCHELSLSAFVLPGLQKTNGLSSTRALASGGRRGRAKMKGRDPDFKRRRSKFVRPSIPAAALSVLIVASTPQASLADEGGVSFWLPGLLGNPLVAVPGQPGWSFYTFGYNTNVSAGANVAAAREITIGALNPTLRANLSAHLTAPARATRHVLRALRRPRLG